jgi:hypothetical protein
LLCCFFRKAVLQQSLIQAAGLAGGQDCPRALPRRPARSGGKLILESLLFFPSAQSKASIAAGGNFARKRRSLSAPMEQKQPAQEGRNFSAEKYRMEARRP